MIGDLWGRLRSRYSKNVLVRRPQKGRFTGKKKQQHAKASPKKVGRFTVKSSKQTNKGNFSTDLSLGESDQKNKDDSPSRLSHATSSTDPDSVLSSEEESTETEDISLSPDLHPSYMSPIFGDYSGLDIPVYVNAAAKEMLSDEVIDFAIVLRYFHEKENGVTLQVDANMIHAHIPFMVSFGLPQSLYSLDLTQKFLDSI